MCHHYPGQKARKIPPGWSELRNNWWKKLELIPVEAYPVREVAILRLNNDDKWLLENRTWGLLHQSWKPSEKVKTANAFQRGKINARSETIDSTWPWKLSWRQRCVLIANGFCEPHKDGGEGLYTVPGHETFAIPGIWDTYSGDDGKGNQIQVESVVMLTCAANDLVAKNRTGRMRQPVVLTETRQIQRYCSHEVTERQQIADLFKPWPADAMEMQHVSKTPKPVKPA